MAITSKEINLAQLSKELGNKGLIGDFNDAKKKIILPADGVDLSEEQLKAAIANHVAIDQNETELAQRKAILDRIGLTADELKLLIG
jgi:hypothetical protein